MATETAQAPAQQSKTPLDLNFLDTDVLVKFTTDTGKILPRKYTGLTGKQQRHATRTIKRSRNMLVMK
jgi:small subunit ribosomal protein S18